MSYEPHTWVNGETITAEKMNAMEQGIAQGGGGGYDLIIENDLENNKWVDFTLSTDQANKLILRKGNFLDLEDKLTNNEPINAVLINHGMWSWVMSGTNIADTGTYMHLMHLDGHYLMGRFYTVGGGILGDNSTNPVTYWNAEIYYDADTGEITHAYFGVKAI